MADSDLKLDGTDLRPTDGTMKLDLIAGFWEPPNARGEDDVIPEASGRDEGVWIKDHRTIKLHGYVKGTGSTLVARQQSFQSTMTTLMGKLDTTASPAALVVSGPYMGLATSPSTVTKSINVRCVNVVVGPITGLYHATVDVELVSIDSPPDWT